MTGSTLAAVLIPVVGTTSLIAWLILVFLARDRSGRTAGGRTR
jgi:hypothetical protein